MSTALYNRYRPATFSQVVGQEHVTGALSRALLSGRLHHAYLFSGPRGCGKTSSARILAASLNCENGPTPEPCGVCEQCVTIRAGSSMDVIEIDAASHGLVDDARDLRERAFFAPASARFKVYVVDEAHMVTAAAFNALLKVVEEPPPYLKFVFATTEPDKVIATIRSRTHHYSFRLVPPGILRDHLASICAQEAVTVDPAVLPLVVRAGAGSVRDSLSVLDQLLAGADESGLDYDRAVALLGMTDGVLLDETVDALAARDGSTVFAVVDKMVSGGHDPRRFATDLLERVRDLIVLAAVPDAADRGLLDTHSADQLDRMRAQAAALGPAELSRTADVLHAGLIEMRGTANPRLVLELVLARAMLPGAAQDTSSLLVRLERLERGLPVGTAPAAAARVADHDAAPAAGGPPTAGAPAAPLRPVTPPPAAPQPTPPRPVAATPPGPPPAARGARPPAPPAPQPTPAVTPRVTHDPAQRPPGHDPNAAAAAASGQPAAAGRITADGLRAGWDGVLLKARRLKPATHALLQEYATVTDVRGDEVVLTFSVPTIARMFGQGSNIDVLCAALSEEYGGTWRVTIEGPTGPGPSGGAARRPPPPGPSSPGHSPNRPPPATPGQPSGPGSFGPGSFGPGPSGGPRAGQHSAAGGTPYSGYSASSAGPNPAAQGPGAQLSGAAQPPGTQPPEAQQHEGTQQYPGTQQGLGAQRPAPGTAAPDAAAPPAGASPQAAGSGAVPTLSRHVAPATSPSKQPSSPNGQPWSAPARSGSWQAPPASAVGPSSPPVSATAAGPSVTATAAPVGSPSVPAPAPRPGSRPSGYSPGGAVGGFASSAPAAIGVDEPSMDDDDVPEGPGAALPGEDAAVALLRSNFGAVVIESSSDR